MILTFALGCVFLGVKGYEYKEKFKHGIYPAKPHSRIYEKADLYYVQGVRQTLVTQRDALTAKQGQLQQEGKSLSEREAEDLATLNSLLTNLVQWTELKAVREQDTVMRRLAIDKMAKGIYPHWHIGPGTEEIKDAYVASLDREQEQIKRDLATAKDDLQKSQQEKANLESKPRRQKRRHRMRPQTQPWSHCKTSPLADKPAAHPRLTPSSGRRCWLKSANFRSGSTGSIPNRPAWKAARK